MHVVDPARASEAVWLIVTELLLVGVDADVLCGSGSIGRVIMSGCSARQSNGSSVGSESIVIWCFPVISDFLPRLRSPGVHFDRTMRRGGTSEWVA